MSRGSRTVAHGKKKTDIRWVVRGLRKLEPWFCAEIVLVVPPARKTCEMALPFRGFGHEANTKKERHHIVVSLFFGGREGTRTPDLLRVKQAL